jgi:putative ABC transport system permease protein
MNIFDTIPIALRALAANKMRSMLTMLGIIIGVGAVISLMAAGQGAQKGITDRIQGLGSNLLFIRPGSKDDNPTNNPLGDTVLTLVSTDVDAINNPDHFPYVVSAVGQVFFTAPVVANGKSVSTDITGVTPGYQVTRNHYVATGRFINDDDMTRKGLVADVGPNLASRLFGEGVDPTGRTVRVTVGQFGFYFSFNFTVIGVMEPKGSNATEDEDNMMIIPLPTMQSRISFIRNPKGVTNVHQITIRLTSSKFTQAKDEISALLRERHGVDKNDFTIQSQSDLVSTANEVSQTLTVLLASIAGISLIVGGIGIMNIMLVSVTERTREIGIRKALGARRVDILWQFIVEALTVTMLGGLVGVGTGVLLAKMANGQHLFGRDLYTAVTPMSIIVAFSVSAAIGLFFGIYPAFRASRLNPIEALRHE